MGWAGESPRNWKSRTFPVCSATQRVISAWTWGLTVTSTAAAACRTAVRRAGLLRLLAQARGSRSMARMLRPWRGDSSGGSWGRASASWAAASSSARRSI